MTREQADNLLARGLITQETYNRAQFEEPAMPETAPVPMTNPVPGFEGDTLPPLPGEDGFVGPQPMVEPIASPVVSNPIEESNIINNTDTQAPSTIRSQTPQPPVYTQVPAGETQTITSSEKKASEEARRAQEDLQKSLQDQKAAQEQLAAVEEEKAAEAFRLNQEAQAVEAENAQRELTLRNEGLAQIQDRLADLDAKTEELANQKYEGYWAKKSTGDKIVGAISMALGAFAQAKGAGPNVALSIINKAADDEFRNYQDTTANKIKAINQSRLNEDAKRRLIGDQVLALQAKKISDIKVIQNKIDNLSNKFASPTAKAKLAALSAQLDEKAAAARQQFELALSETVNTSVQRKLATVQLDPATGKPVQQGDRKDALALAKEYRSHPEVKAANAIRTSQGKLEAMVKRAATSKTGAADMALIFGFMKTLDPGSTVREGEFANAENSGGIDARISNVYNSIVQGKRLTPKQRQEFLEASRDMAKIHEDRAAAIADEYRDTASRFGMDPEQVVGRRRETEKEANSPRTVTKKQYSPSRNQTKITYSDGSTEIVDGKQ